MPLWAAVASQTAAVGVASPIALPPMFLVFAKIGSVLFGSGYVLLAFLRADLVERLGWLTEATARRHRGRPGHARPGIHDGDVHRLRLGGLPARVATVGIFLPAFVFVALSAPLVPRCALARRRARPRRRQRRVARADGERHDDTREGHAGRRRGIGIALVSVVLLVRYRVSTSILIVAGGVVGLLLR